MSGMFFLRHTVVIHCLKQVPSLNLNPEVDFDFMAAILKNRYDYNEIWQVEAKSHTVD